MQIVPEILKKVELAEAQLVAVTKYFSPEETLEIFNELSSSLTVWALGENRIVDIRQKNIPREKLHFIGNIQSRDIPEIAERCSVIHSLCSLKHAEIFSKQPVVPEVFLQVNVSREPQKSGISPEDVPAFLHTIQAFGLNILGISAMGVGDFEEDQKRAEFRELIHLRDTFFPGKRISAGTSRDFELALEEGIDVIRVGQALFDISIQH